MALGRLRCLGTPMHLKSKFGTGYQLIISLRPEAVYSKVDDFVRSRLSPAANLVPTWKGESFRTYNLPEGSVKISKVFESMSEQTKRDLGIKEWSLNQTSLNEVFLRIAEGSERGD